MKKERELFGDALRHRNGYPCKEKMMKIILIAILMAALLTGCAVQTAPDGPGAASDAPDGLKPLGFQAELKAQPVEALSAGFVRGVNGFGFDAASRLFGDENLALSPASIELALCMTRAGAAGQTKGGHGRIVGPLRPDRRTDCKTPAARCMWRANTGGMEAADALWVSEGLTLSDAFAKTCADDFMADAYALEIPGAMDAINAWASEKTNGRIDDIIREELDPATRMVLANALYFLGDWAEPFKAEDTYDEAFHASPGDVTSSFMHSTRHAALL